MNNGADIRRALDYSKKEVKKPNPFKHDVLYTPEGQWKYPGQITKIPDRNITMKGVDYPVLGIDDLGNEKMMYPGMDYTFPGQTVTEYPIGGTTQASINNLIPTQNLAKKNKNTIASIKNSILKGETINPLEVKSTGQGLSIKDGHHRYLAYKELGIDNVPVQFQEGGGWLEELKIGGTPSSLNQQKAKRGKTSKNIQSSINKIFLRNHTLFGHSGKNIYDPTVKFEGGGWLEEYQNAGSTGVKQPYIIPEKDLQFAALPKEKQDLVRQSNLMKLNKRPEAKLSQGKKLNEVEQAYSDKVKARIDNPFSDIGIAAGNVASYLTRLRGLSPEEIAKVTNNPMETIGLSSELGTQAIANELMGAGLIKVGVKAAPYVKHIAEDVPHYLPKVSIKEGKLNIKPAEFVDYYRAQPHGFKKSTAPYNPNLTPEQNAYTGHWVETDPERILDYVKGVQSKNPDLGNPLYDIIKGRMPKSRLEQLKGANLPEQAKKMSYGPGKYGTWEKAFEAGAITDLEKRVMTLAETNPELIKKGTYHKSIHDNMVKKIAENPELIRESEALMTPEKVSLMNIFNKSTKLGPGDVEKMLKGYSEGALSKYKKYSPFEEGGNWLDNLTEI